jgi:hypothetical protein
VKLDTEHCKLSLAIECKIISQKPWKERETCSSRRFVALIVCAFVLYLASTAGSDTDGHTETRAVTYADCTVVLLGSFAASFSPDKSSRDRPLVSGTRKVIKNPTPLMTARAIKEFFTPMPVG